MGPGIQTYKKRRVYKSNIDLEKMIQASKGYEFESEDNDPKGRENYCLLTFKRQVA